MYISCDACHVPSEEDVLDKKRKRMSIGESVTAKKARLAVDDTDTFVGQKSSTKQPKQVTIYTVYYVLYFFV